TEVRSTCEKHVPLQAIDNAHKCTECEFKYASKVDLSNHLISHSIYACDKCEYRNNSIQGLKGHIKIHSQKKLKCSQCEFKGTSTNTLSNHMKTHIGEKICSVSTSENASRRSLSSKRDLSV
ncbi:unnamed protein product, partial [Meganyctiphanes norvegica]